MFKKHFLLLLSMLKTGVLPNICLQILLYIFFDEYKIQKNSINWKINIKKMLVVFTVAFDQSNECLLAE